jgi:hypothetical protein
VVEDVERDDVRENMVPPYRIVYTIGTDIVRVVMIRHGARRFAAGDVLDRL